MSRPDASTVGSYWRDREGQVWKQVSYTDQPVVAFECIYGRSKGKSVSEVVGCLNLEDRELTPVGAPTRDDLVEAALEACYAWTPPGCSHREKEAMERLAQLIGVSV